MNWRYLVRVIHSRGDRPAVTCVLDAKLGSDILCDSWAGVCSVAADALHDDYWPHILVYDDLASTDEYAIDELVWKHSVVWDLLNGDSWNYRQLLADMRQARVRMVEDLAGAERSS